MWLADGDDLLPPDDSLRRADGDRVPNWYSSSGEECRSSPTRPPHCCLLPSHDGNPPPNPLSQYIVLLFKARKELAIPELRLSDKSRMRSFLDSFFGYYAKTSAKQHDDAEWEKLREEHYLSFLIQPYERRVFWFEVVEVFRRLFLSGVLILFGAGTVTQVVCACGICLFSKFAVPPPPTAATNPLLNNQPADNVPTRSLPLFTSYQGIPILLSV
jgi:hypothetical protein